MSAVLGDLLAGGSLSVGQASAVFTEILSGSATPAQVAGIAVALRSRGETVDEMTGFVQAMLALSEPVPLPTGVVESLVDTCGTGGDGSHSINVSTLAAFTVAAAGVKVCKHGGRAASSRTGSADVLEALGVNVELGPSGVAACVEGAGIGFCFAPRFHPAMRHAAPVRRELGVPTIFNFLGPLANPARVRRQVIGVSDFAMGEKMVAVLAAMGSERVLVVHGDDGMDELSITAGSTVWDFERSVGEVRTYRVEPSALGLAPAVLADLTGGGPRENAEIAKLVLSGERGPRGDVVALNAAAALVVAGRSASIEEGLALARGVLESGAPMEVLDRLVRISNLVEATPEP